MFILVLVLLLVTNVGWFGVFLDRSLALSDAGSEIDQQEKVAKTLGVLLVELPKKMDLQQAATWLRAKHPEWIVKEREQKLEVDNVVLEFHGDTLIRVTPF